MGFMGRVRIQLVEVSKSYYSEAAVTQALRKISVSFGVGEFVAVTGESGSGKSTLLHIIGGLDTFDDGEMFIDGEPTFQYDDADWEDYRRNKIGYVFQDYSLIGHYTALDNVISALLIMDKDRKTAEQTARDYLHQVGLDGFEMHRASQLSSGQKQRLSIARALAKDTGIILADEPTGNLDSETADSIVQLLKELSKTRLVIMVTHNYDLIAPYATRRIRPHDGELVSDVSGAAADVSSAQGDSLPTVNTEEKEEATEQKKSDPAEQSQTGKSTKGSTDENYSNISSEDNENSDKQQIKANENIAPELANDSKASEGKKQHFKFPSPKANHVALFLANRNRNTQIGRSTLFLVFFLVVSVASFVFIGQLALRADDRLVMKYSQAAYYDEETTRLDVRNSDGSALTDADLDRIRSLRYVEAVDSCDYANDINYYMNEGTDYSVLYGIQRSKDSTREIYEYSFDDESHFMRSVDCISESDLADGRLPESLTEIALYSDDPSVLGTTVTVFFTAHNLWSYVSTYCSYELTIVGLLREDTDQVYFSHELCWMFGTYADGGGRLYEVRETVGGAKNYIPMVTIIKEDLEGSQIRGGNLNAKSDDQLDATGGIYAFGQIDNTGNPVGDMLDMSFHSIGYVDNSPYVIEVSSKWFYHHYEEECTEAAVYLHSYALTDEAIRALGRMGYEAISTYRVSVSGYSDRLSNTRMVIIGICILGLIVLALAEILILRSLMKIRIKDYYVLQFIGMKLHMIRRISYDEMFVHSIAAIILTVVIMWILRLCGVGMVTDMMWYVKLPYYLCFVVYNLLLCLLTVAAFNHLLKGRLKK